MAVDKVDRLEEPKEHKHVDALVRQGPFQGMITFLGLLVPLAAIYSTLHPATNAGEKSCLPSSDCLDDFFVGQNIDKESH